MQAARSHVIRLSLSMAALVAFAQVPAAGARVAGGSVVPVAVATHFGPFGPDRPGRQSLRVLAVGRGAIPTADSDNVTLLCRPRPANRPCSATTSSTSTSTSTTTSSTTTTTSSTTSTTAVSSTTSSTTTTVTSTTASPT